MAQAAEIDDMIALTGKYYARLQELLARVPDDHLSARAGARGLAVAETIDHVCRSDPWYLNLIDGGSRQIESLSPDRHSLADGLRQTEGLMIGFLEALTPDVLAATREVPAWWAEGAERSVRLILMHSLAHKYYHCGQLQSILHLLGGEQ